MKIIKIFILILFTFLLTGCNKKYNITFDVNGGVMPEKYQDTFKENKKYDFPIPTKEGYLFVGWTENEVFIDKLDPRDYSLQAKYIEEEVVEYNYITDKEIFLQAYDEYLVYFMKDNCSWCSKIKDDVLRYQYKLSLEQYQKNIKLFVVNLHTPERKSMILREYKEDGGNDGFYVDGVTKWDSLYIPSTPTLIKISTENNIKKATFLNVGATNTKNKLQEYLIDSNDYSSVAKEYNITYDCNGGTFSETPISTFYGWSAFDLPTPTLDGYTFVGWYEDDKLVTKLDPKDYNLIAKWKKTIELLTIEKEEIFHKEGNYYCIFVRNLHNLEEFVANINQYNTYAKYHSLPQVYVIDLVKCEEIYRSYDDNKYGIYVDGAKEWNELYISERYTLIYLTDDNETKTAKYITHTKNRVFEYLNEKYRFSIN